jgi:hypothetical protein
MSNLIPQMTDLSLSRTVTSTPFRTISDGSEISQALLTDNLSNYTGVQCIPIQSSVNTSMCQDFPKT